MASKSHQWFKSHGHFSEGVDLAYWKSFNGKGLRLQHAQQQACLHCSLMLNSLSNGAHCCFELELNEYNVNYTI